MAAPVYPPLAHARTVPECTGACCTLFPLGDSTYENLLSRAAVRPLDAELQLVAAMLIRVERRPEGDLFTCRHLDPATRRCQIYGQRPRMCREYPYGLQCGHCRGYGLALPEFG